MAEIMIDQAETYQRASVPAAAGILGASVATVRRRIRDGSLRAEPVHRPQGTVYVVLLGNDHERHGCHPSWTRSSSSCG